MEEDTFRFTAPERIVPKRVGVVLTALARLGVTPTETPSTELDSTTTLGVNEMDEEAVARYLHDFYLELSSGRVESETLATHRVFQAVLRRASAMQHSS
jgi:hypothetical protein